MILNKGQGLLLQAPDLETDIDVASKGIDCGTGRLRSKAAESLGIERRKTIGNMHQRAELILAQLRGGQGDVVRVRLETRPRRSEGRLSEGR